MKYPIERTEYICSDGRIFCDREDAIAWQQHLDLDKPSVYSSGQDDYPF